MKKDKHNRTQMTQIKQMNSDKISENHSDQRNQRSIPPHWSWVKLGNICEFIYGKGLIKSKRNENGKFPVYGSNGIVGYHNEFLVKGHCLIIGRKGAAGEVHLSTKNCWPIDTTYYVTQNEKYSLPYLYYIIKTLKLSALDKSTAIPGLNRNDVYKLSIPLPPLAEQKKIVEKIEELFSQLDSGVAALKKAKEQLRLYRQSVLAAAFSGKLTTKNTQSTKNLSELSALSGLPTDWKWVKLGEIIKVSSGKGLNSAKMKSNGKYAVYGGNGISGYYDEYFWEESKLIIGRVGAKCGVMHITKPKSWITDNALIVDFITNKVETKFLYHCLTYHNLNKLSVSTAQPVISGAKMYPYKIMLPPITQQLQIVSEIEKRFSEADNLEKAIDESLAKAETLRQSILKQAFEGRLV